MTQSKNNPQGLPHLLQSFTEQIIVDIQREICEVPKKRTIPDTPKNMSRITSERFDDHVHDINLQNRRTDQLRAELLEKLTSALRCKSAVDAAIAGYGKAKGGSIALLACHLDQALEDGEDRRWFANQLRQFQNSGNCKAGEWFRHLAYPLDCPLELRDLCLEDANLIAEMARFR